MSTTLVCGSALEISGCIPWGISAKFVPADRRGSPPQSLTGAGIGRPISEQVAFTMKSVLGGGRVVLAGDVQGRAASALGGWLAGLIADRVGRVRTLQITILWFALFTGLCGLAQSYGQLLAARALMGLGFGGEWAAGAVLMGEVIAARHRGKAVGAVQSGWALGWGAAALLYTIMFSILPEQTAWRVLFLAGILPSLLVLYIRRSVEEPAVFRAARESGARGRFWEIFAPDIAPTTALAALLATGAQGGYYAITTWLPTYLKTVRGLSVFNTGGYLGVVIAGSFCGYLVSAWLSDQLGRKRNFYLFSLCSMATVLAYTLTPISDRAMLVLGFPLGFFASGIFSGMGAFFTELFPTRIRGSGQGFSYNFGRGVGALFPSVIGFLSASMPLGRAIGIFAAAAYALLFVAAVLLPETRGRELAAIA
ncbi:MAG: MFS transporter [Deltaproteobacteria bacterium]|nr:MAG: MFS transporter [Deltaproteobacteria bacterium]